MEHLGNRTEEFVTNKFYQDRTILSLKRKKYKLPREVEISGISLGATASPWGNTKKVAKHGEERSVSYRTRFVLYTDGKQYYLHKLGESQDKDEETFYSLIEFSTPAEFKALLDGKAPGGGDIYASRPVLKLVGLAVQSEYLTEEERDTWYDTLLCERR